MNDLREQTFHAFATDTAKELSATLARIHPENEKPGFSSQGEPGFRRNETTNPTQQYQKRP